VMRIALVTALAGCSFVPVAATPGDGSAMHDAPMIDSPIDAPPDAFDPNCFAGGAFYFCLTTPPSGNQSVGDIDTDQCNDQGAQLAMIGQTSVCVVAGSSLDVGDSNVTGSRPLVLVATGDITQSGYLDASSATGRGDGPGANDPSCTMNTNDGSNNAGGAGGGAGGSFGTPGATGATGNGTLGGTPGAAAMQPVATLRGGCKGGFGGAGTNGQAQPGSGGGAVMLVARGTIHITGTIDVSAAGGSGGHQSKGGGGGGGSGGMIVLYGTVSATSAAILFANGGGGGGGAGQNADGNPGNDATLYNMAAAGGATNGGGSTPGGSGGFGMTAPTKPGTSTTGGGGGGGSVGVIRLLGGAQLGSAKVSPPPS